MIKGAFKNPIGVVLTILFLLFAHAANASEDAYQVGWFQWDPYVFETTHGGIHKLTGLNVELANAAFERMQLEVEWKQVDWKAHLERMRRGESAIAVGASRTAERDSYAWFSEPFIEENIVLMGHHGDLRSHGAHTPTQLLAACATANLRLAYVEGYYYGEEVMQFIEELPPHLRVPTLNDKESLERLLKRKADILVADRMVASTIAWRADVLDQIEVSPIVLHRSPLHVMFSKAVFPESVKDAYNQAFSDMKAEKEVNGITRRYMLPILLGITLHTEWFVWIGSIGVFAFAISGVLLARKEGYDIFGALVLAALPALGGGVLRDLLTDRHPILLFRSNLLNYIYIVICVVIGATILFKLHDWILARRPQQDSLFGKRFTGLPMHIVGVCDALGLSAFIISGVVIAIEQRCEPLWLWGSFIAAVTASGGGILRDIVRADTENPMIKGEFYPEIALLWGFGFSLFLEWQVTRLSLMEISIGVLVTMLGAFLTRMLVIYYEIRSPLLSRKTI